MCGRFTQAYTWAQVFEALSAVARTPLEQAAVDRIKSSSNLQPRYNISPTTQIDIIRLDKTGAPVLDKARWGLVPPWHKGSLKDLKISTFNARVETVDSAASFRRAYKARRCVIPADGFFEWTGDKSDRVPHFISSKDGRVLGFAGLWETWTAPDGEEILSATIIVKEADRFMSAIHSRMPCILHPDDFLAWLDGSGGKELLQAPSPELRDWIVSKTVNKAGAGADDPATVEPA